MKEIKNIFIALMLLTIFIIPDNSIAQGIIITKTGDTIVHTKFDRHSRKPKYWTNDSEKAIKIDLAEISITFNFPEYTLTKNEVDEFTGNLKRYSKFVVIGGTKRDINNYSNALVVWMKKIATSNKTVYLLEMRTPTELGCSGANENYTMLKFKNGDVIKLDNDISKIDCNKNAVSKYVINNEVLNKLRNNELSSVRFKQSEYYEDYYIIFPDCLIKTIELLDE